MVSYTNATEAIKYWLFQFRLSQCKETSSSPKSIKLTQKSIELTLSPALRDFICTGKWQVVFCAAENEVCSTKQLAPLSCDVGKDALRSRASGGKIFDLLQAL